MDVYEVQFKLYMARPVQMARRPSYILGPARPRRPPCALRWPVPLRQGDAGAARVEPLTLTLLWRASGKVHSGELERRGTRK